jgi:hypothetical protein
MEALERFEKSNPVNSQVQKTEVNEESLEERKKRLKDQRELIRKKIHKEREQ